MTRTCAFSDYRVSHGRSREQNQEVAVLVGISLLWSHLSSALGVITFGISDITPCARKRGLAQAKAYCSIAVLYVGFAQ